MIGYVRRRIIRVLPPFVQGVKPVQKQSFNIYTMMLILSFLALVTACILLYLELQLHGSYPWWKPLG